MIVKEEPSEIDVNLSVYEKVYLEDLIYDLFNLDRWKPGDYEHKLKVNKIYSIRSDLRKMNAGKLKQCWGDEKDGLKWEITLLHLTVKLTEMNDFIRKHY